MKNLLFLLMTFVIFSCSPPETESDICIDNMLQILEMERYDGSIEADCKDYLSWSTYEGNDYFMIDNACADIMLHLWDCDKVDICVDYSDECQTILSNMARQGIIARSK